MKVEKIKRYVWTQRFLGLFALLEGVTYFFATSEFLYAINFFPNVFKLAEPAPMPTDRFWVILAASYSIGLCALSWLAAESPKVRGYGLVQILTRLCSTAGFALAFFNEHRYFIYLFAVFVNLAISSMIAWQLIRMGVLTEDSKSAPPEPKN